MSSSGIIENQLQLLYIDTVSCYEGSSFISLYYIFYSAIVHFECSKLRRYQQLPQISKRTFPGLERCSLQKFTKFLQFYRKHAEI
jgi:heme oxygenase